VLAKLGCSAVRWSRPMAGTSTTVTVSREADGWYACVACAEVPVQSLPLTGRAPGSDVGLKVFRNTADEGVVEHPRHYRKAEKHLKQSQQRFSRKKQGSKRRNQARNRLATKPQQVRRQRQDFHHKGARMLVRNDDAICLEDRRVATLVRTSQLATSICDAGGSQLRSTLEYQAACAGKHVVLVAPHDTAQDCSACGARVQKRLSVRTQVCPSCGLVAHRDHHAALTIVRAGQARRGAAGSPAVVQRASVGL